MAFRIVTFVQISLFLSGSHKKMIQWWQSLLYFTARANTWQCPPETRYPNPPSPTVIHNISSFISILMSQAGSDAPGWYLAMALSAEKHTSRHTREPEPLLFRLTNLRRASGDYASNSPFHVILHQKYIILLKIFIPNSMSSTYLNIYYCLHWTSFARESICSPYSQSTRRTA